MLRITGLLAIVATVFALEAAHYEDFLMTVPPTNPKAYIKTVEDGVTYWVKSDPTKWSQVIEDIASTTEIPEGVQTLLGDDSLLYRI